MDLTHQILYRNVDILFFIYGFIYLIMGIAILIQPKKISEFELAGILWLLGSFGIIHGLYQILNMWAMLKGRVMIYELGLWLLLMLSYSLLFEFGRRLFRLKIPQSSSLRKRLSAPLRFELLPLIITFILFTSSLSDDFLTAGNIWVRYLLCLPAGILIGIGFHSYYYSEEESFRPIRVKKYFFIAGIAFLIYGVIGGTIVPKGEFLPANLINRETFLRMVKIPVEALLAICAIIATWAIAGMLRIFTWEINNKLQRAHEILKEKLRESEARYLEIIQSSTDMIHSIDREGVIVSLNIPAWKVLGYNENELIGRNIKDICTHRTWDDIQGTIERSIREGSAFLDHAKLIKKNGAEIDVAVHAISMFDSQKNLLGIRLTFRDITEQKRAEEALRESEAKYRLLFEESQDTIFISDREGRIIDINKSGLEMFGYGKDEISMINPNQLFVDPEGRERFLKEIEEREFVRDYPVQLKKKSGKIMDCLITSSVRRSKHGQIIGFQGIIRDITEQKKMEEELQKIEKLESLGIMAGGIAHDFNNLLTIISGNLSIAKSLIQKDHTKLNEIINEAEEASRHARNLTNQLLTFSKGGAPIMKVLRIQDLLKESAIFALRGSNIECKFEIDDSLRPVKIDEGQMRQVIYNLVINARQAITDRGSIIIRAENTERPEEPFPLYGEKFVKISVIDTGVGIPKEHLKKIFDPYFTTKEDGSGLGLASTYSIIKNHGGYIRVSSEVGVGTEFNIYLPAVTETVPEKREKEASYTNRTGKILVLDDENFVLKTVCRMLNYLGYEPYAATTGEEAISLYKDALKSGTPFDAVIIDLTIKGGLGGKETMEKLLEIDPGVRAIVSSGYSNDPVMSDFRRYGFCAVLPKPFEIDDLQKILSKIMRGEIRV